MKFPSKKTIKAFLDTSLYPVYAPEKEEILRNIPWWKRPFDIVVSLFCIILFTPIMLLIALAIKLTDGGKVIYSHTRIGYNGKKIKVFKFRSMYMDAEDRLKNILDTDENAKKEWERTFKLKNDPRVTPIGKFLRKTSLDELPQFFNVLKGDMSIVGPRPVVQEELEKFYKDKAIIYKSVKPGVTGYWQVEGRSDIEDYEERVKMDEFYIKNQSFWLDIKIILKTIKVMCTGKGAY